MKKSEEQIIDEMNRFDAMTKADQDAERKRLGAELVKLDERIGSNSKAIEAAGKEARALDDEIALASKKYGELREKRKKSFSLELDTKDLDAEIFKLKTDIENLRELREDRVAGISQRISDLKKESELLEEEKWEIGQSLLRYDDIPRVRRFNELIGEAFKIFEKIVVNQQENLKYKFNPFGAGPGFPMIFLSDWRFLDENIGRLYLRGGAEEKDRLPLGRLRWAWSMAEFMNERRRKAEKG